MTFHIAQYLAQCERCALAKPEQVKTPLGTIVAREPMEVVAVDFTVLEPASDGRENILVITDIFTKWTACVPTHDQKATTVARALSRKWFVRYGVPSRIHSDKGRSLEVQVVPNVWH